MPGIPMQVFRRQVDQLLLAYTLPSEFRRQLSGLFERYGVFAYRVSDSSAGVPEPAYHVPMLAIREIEAALPPLAAERPMVTLHLARELWKDKYYEVRRLGAFLVGWEGADEAESVLAFLEEQGLAEERDEMLVLLLEFGSRTLRREKPRLWLERVEEWVRAPKPGLRRMGLLALFSIVRDDEFENLPPVFRLLEPILLNPTRRQEVIVSQMVRELAKRSPMECAYFLHEIAPYVKPERARRMMRSFVDLFEGEAHEHLRESLMQKMEPEEGG